jgi:transcriptional regulator GlxA family with amidase domain
MRHLRSVPEDFPKGQYRRANRDARIARMTANTTTRRKRKAVGSRRSSVSQLERYRRLVGEFERMASANSVERSNLAAFCTAAGISQRTLLRAFRAVHGVSAHRYLQSVRLAQARSMLSAGDPETATVTEIATQCGFLELGRFSLLYRRNFGETPSQTLSRKPSVPVRERERPRPTPGALRLFLAESTADEPEKV